MSFSALFSVFTLTWITEKQLERVTENKGDEFRRKKNIAIQSGGEKMRNASRQQGENERQSCKTTTREREKSVLHVHICVLLIRRKCVLHVQFVFLLIRSISLEAIFIVVPI